MKVYAENLLKQEVASEETGAFPLCSVRPRVGPAGGVPIFRVRRLSDGAAAVARRMWQYRMKYVSIHHGLQLIHPRLFTDRVTSRGAGRVMVARPDPTRDI